MPTLGLGVIEGKYYFILPGTEDCLGMVNWMQTGAWNMRGREDYQRDLADPIRWFGLQ